MNKMSIFMFGCVGTLILLLILLLVAVLSPNDKSDDYVSNAFDIHELKDK